MPVLKTWLWTEMLIAYHSQELWMAGACWEFPAHSFFSQPTLGDDHSSNLAISVMNHHFIGVLFYFTFMKSRPTFILISLWVQNTTLLWCSNQQCKATVIAASNITSDYKLAWSKTFILHTTLWLTDPKYCEFSYSWGLACINPYRITMSKHWVPLR